MTNQIDITSITPSQLAEMQAAALAQLPTVPTEQELREFQRRMDAEEARREREEKAKKEAETRRARLLKVATAIAAALKRAAPDRNFEAGTHEFGDAYVREAHEEGRYSRLPSIRISWEEAGGSRYSFRTHYTGKTRVTVGEYGSKTSYPQRKDGTHSYDKIAEAAVARMLDDERRRRVARSAELAKRDNEVVASALREKLGASKWGGGDFSVNASSVAERPVFVECKISRTMTADDTEKLHAALVALGLVKKQQ